MCNKRYYRKEVFACGEYSYMKVYRVSYGTKTERTLHHFEVVDDGCVVAKFATESDAITRALVLCAEQR